MSSVVWAMSSGIRKKGHLTQVIRPFSLKFWNILPNKKFRLTIVSYKISRFGCRGGFSQIKPVNEY